MAEGVAPSKLGTQPIGEIARVAEGVYQLKLPVPFPLRFVSVYLIEDDDGWTIIDSGHDYPPTYEALGRGAAEVGCDLSNDVARIVVHHAERLDVMRSVLEGGPKTAYAVSRIVFRGTVTVRQRCFALAETLARLDHLVLEGRAERLAGDGALAYRAG